MMKTLGTKSKRCISTRIKELRDELKALKGKAQDQPTSPPQKNIKRCKLSLSLRGIQDKYEEARNKAALSDYTQSAEYKNEIEVPKYS